jgi:hypothetical protein
VQFAAKLRRELAELARKYAAQNSLPHSITYGDDPTVCFTTYENNLRHGNFQAKSYQAILANRQWEQRLRKVHTLSARCLPRFDRRWRELDSCSSSDALLMNIFCHPKLSQSGKLSAFLSVESKAPLCFGYKAKVPLVSGRFDRTEIDLRLGELLVEAKLTENDFRSARLQTLLTYRDLSEVFHYEDLPRRDDSYDSYQLIRNVLAAHALNCSFCLLVDARRPDLIDDWYQVMKCVKLLELRTRLRIATWQELARVTTPQVTRFLASKYGISAPRFGAPLTPHLLAIS